MKGKYAHQLEAKKKKKKLAKETFVSSSGCEEMLQHQVSEMKLKITLRI